MLPTGFEREDGSSLFRLVGKFGESDVGYFGYFYFDFRKPFIPTPKSCCILTYGGASFVAGVNSSDIKTSFFYGLSTEEVGLFCRDCLL
jgi:hypothetical protein